MKHCPSLTPAELAKKRAAYAARDCRTYSRRASVLLNRVWQEYEAQGADLDPEEAECLLAAVDAAAESARTLLQAMGAGRAVRDWERRTARYAVPPLIDC